MNAPVRFAAIVAALIATAVLACGCSSSDEQAAPASEANSGDARLRR